MPNSIFFRDSAADPHTRLIRALRAIGTLCNGDEAAVRGGIRGSLRRLNAYQDIVAEGEQPSAVAILVEGFAHRYKMLRDGNRQILSFHIPGDIPDVQSLFLKTMDHGLAALGPCMVLHVEHKTMFDLFERAPHLAHLFWRGTLIEASVFREWITNIGQRESYTRIAHLLCEMVYRMHMIGLSDGRTCELPMRQQDIADATGISAVHVNRSLQAIRKDGLIALEARSLTVHDWDRLAVAGDFDPKYLHPNESMVPPINGVGQSGAANDPLHP